jgi:hypothetical protein
MLKIVDLNRNEELSASSMGKVTGGMSCEEAVGVASCLSSLAGFFGSVGAPAVGLYTAGLAKGIMEGGCSP